LGIRQFWIASWKTYRHIYIYITSSTIQYALAIISHIFLIGSFLDIASDLELISGASSSKKICLRVCSDQGVGINSSGVHAVIQVHWITEHPARASGIPIPPEKVPV